MLDHSVVIVWSSLKYWRNYESFGEELTTINEKKGVSVDLSADGGAVVIEDRYFVLPRTSKTEDSMLILFLI